MSINTIKQIIENNNTMYEEEGSYVSINLIETKSNPIIVFVDLNDGSNFDNYEIDDTFINKLTGFYEKSGGDEEYDSIENYILSKDELEKCSLNML